MMGYDLCSPEGNKTSDNRECHSACREEEEGEKHYKCAVSHDSNVKHHCGNWDIKDLNTRALEYDDQERVALPFLFPFSEPNLRMFILDLRLFRILCHFI